MSEDDRAAKAARARALVRALITYKDNTQRSTAVKQEEGQEGRRRTRAYGHSVSNTILGPRCLTCHLGGPGLAYTTPCVQRL